MPEKIKIDMGRLDNVISRFEKSVANAPSASMDELSSENILAELRTIKKNGRIKTEFQEQIYRNLVMYR